MKFLQANWELILKWVVVLAACLFLTHKLIYFSEYDRLLSWWRQMPLAQSWWLVAVVALLPVNWLVEALKWNLLTAPLQKLSLKTSVRAVLAGISTGFFTPNRVGELMGRVLYLDAGNRKAGVALSIVSSLTQNLVMAIFGIPAFVILFYSTTNVFAINMQYFLLSVLAFLVLFLALYFSLPKLSRYFAQTKIAAGVRGFADGLALHSRSGLFRIVGVSMLRYIVFCLQFFLMLRFFGVQLQLSEALIAIPAHYLIVTFLPSFAFSEAAVRSSSAVLIVGLYSGLVANIALAGICVWAVNFIVPMLVGLMLLAPGKNGIGA
ncbi:MAG: lysylphosphatidylglycerol synthase domain-containing protein [Paludibacter sp.]